MINPDLEKYIQTARSKNIPDESIKNTLTQSGWQEKEIMEALTPELKTTL